MNKHLHPIDPDHDIQLRQPTGDVAKSRPCLRCREAFDSEGFGDRICRKCKSSSSWRNGLATTYGSSARKR